LDRFDPLQGQLIREPQSPGAGYWVGAPGVFHDRQGDTIYLLYRLRRPRGVPADRGAEVRLAASQNGLRFTDIWTLHKDQLPAASIERCALNQSPDGRFLLYVSYVDPADNRWRIDVTSAARPEKFEIQGRKPVLTAAAIGVEGVKDPWVMRLGAVYFMVVSYATVETTTDRARLHATADAYNTGLVKSRTGLALSLDAERFQWEGELFAPSEAGWDSYAARISCLWHEPPLWWALYDGSAGVTENYEERCGLAVGSDFRRLTRVTRLGPWITVPYRSGSVRYVDVLPLADRTLVYYEMVRPDGSHDLRCYAVDRQAT
jgi:hypothetical protein